MTNYSMAQKLNAQMNLEFHASHLYLSLSNTYMTQKQHDAGAFLRHQAQKCVTHMMLFFEYIKSCGAHPVIEFATITDNTDADHDHILTQILENQSLRIYELQCLAQEAKVNTDAVTLRLLNNIHTEQQESCNTFKRHLKLCHTGAIALAC